jgi:hypothetical protein
MKGGVLGVLLQRGMQEDFGNISREKQLDNFFHLLAK